MEIGATGTHESSRTFLNFFGKSLDSLINQISCSIEILLRPSVAILKHDFSLVKQRRDSCPIRFCSKQTTTVGSVFLLQRADEIFPFESAQHLFVCFQCNFLGTISQQAACLCPLAIFLSLRRRLSAPILSQGT